MQSVAESDQLERASAQGLEAERNFRWNATWLAIDSVCFGVGMAFANQSTVLPTFVSRLTDSASLIGLTAALQGGGFLLPQLVAANFMAGKSRKKRWMVVPAFIGRPLFWLLALVTLLLGASPPELLLLVFFVCTGAFYFLDGLVGVTWFDIVSRVAPPDRRGRLFGLMQTGVSIAGVILGGVVAAVLASEQLPFPTNYALLFALAGTFLVLGAIALGLVREPPLPSTTKRLTLREFWRTLTPILRDQPNFRLVTVARLFFGLGTMIYPFYVVYATRQLGASTDLVGLYLSAQVSGGVLSGLVLGYVGDRFGICRAMQAAAVIGMVGPGVGLLTLATRDGVGTFAPFLVVLSFVSVGVSLSATLIAFVNYVIGIAPVEERTTYIGLFNTLNGVLLAAPLLSGVLLEAAGYSVLFGTALGCFGVVLVLASRLPEPARAM